MLEWVEHEVWTISDEFVYYSPAEYFKRFKRDCYSRLEKLPLIQDEEKNMPLVLATPLLTLTLTLAIVCS